MSAHLHFPVLMHKLALYMPGTWNLQSYYILIIFTCAIGSINSHYFHIIGDGKINPIVGVYIPIIRIPIKGGMTIPNIATFNHGTHANGYSVGPAERLEQRIRKLIKGPLVT